MCVCARVYTVGMYARVCVSARPCVHVTNSVCIYLQRARVRPRVEEPQSYTTSPPPTLHLTCEREPRFHVVYLSQHFGEAWTSWHAIQVVVFRPDITSLASTVSGGILAQSQSHTPDDYTSSRFAFLAFQP